jgi:hypothetical protein
MYRAVLDSCVLFPMYLRDTLLCVSEAGLYVPHWSQEILDGATRNLVNTGRLTTTQAMKLEASEILKLQSQSLKNPPIP